MKKHENQVAIVTGASIGIGRAIALRLAEGGAAICILDIADKDAQATRDALVAAGHKAVFMHADVTDFAQTEAAIREAEAELGPVNLLVNNAGFTDAGDYATMELARWHREIDINLNGQYHLLRAVLPGMQARKAGVVVNIASVNGVRYFGNPAYSAAKAGVINMTQSIASEYGKYGIRCNAVLPGSVQTENVSWEIRQQKDPQIFEKLAKWYPLGRVAQPDDVAKAVSFLASDDAAYITGVGLPVDGGLLAGMNVMIDEFILESK